MKKSEDKNYKIWLDLYKKIEEKVLPNIAYYTDKFDTGILDIDIADEDFIKKYGITHDKSIFFYELLETKGSFIRLITKDDSDGTFDFYIINEESVDGFTHIQKSENGFEYVCGDLMIDNLVDLMEFGKMLMKILEYYLQQEKELKELNKKLDSLGNIYQNGLLTEKFVKKKS